MDDSKLKAMNHAELVAEAMKIGVEFRDGREKRELLDKMSDSALRTLIKRNT